MNTRPSIRQCVHALLVGGLLAGCSDGGSDPDLRTGGGHSNFTTVELALAGTDTVLAVWDIDNGWLTPTDEPLDVLPPSVPSGDTLEPLRAGGAPTSLDVRMRNEQALEIAPLPGGPVDGNPCGEFSSRYFPLDDETPVIAWPNISDSAQPGGPGLFAERLDGETVQIFFCDRLDIYPEQAGIANIELHLWHVSHADQASDALPVEVLEAERDLTATPGWLR